MVGGRGCGGPSRLINLDFSADSAIKIGNRGHSDWDRLILNDIDELRDHLYCQIELDEYDDGHLTVECTSCNKILLEIYPLLLPKIIKKQIRKHKVDRKNYRVSR